MGSIEASRHGGNFSLEKHLICSICMDSFKSPVTTDCGHTFCKTCLHCNFQYNDRMCPLCKQPQRKAPGVNIVLKNIIQQMSRPERKVQNEYRGEPGQVACDVCTGPKLQAEKSCLVCLTSYCSTHIQNHFLTARLQGHKLVPPVKNLDERACLQHGRPLELYSSSAARCVCVRCLEDVDGGVVSTENEWNKKKAKIGDVTAELEKEVKGRKEKVDATSTSLKSCLEQIDSEWRDVEAVFQSVVTMVEKAQERALQPLKDRRRQVETEAKSITDKLQGEVSRLEETISALHSMTLLEDHVLCLQSFPSCEERDSGWVDMELDTSLSFGTMRKLTSDLLEKIQQELEKLTATELQRIPGFSVDVKLDAATAHRSLVLSDDLKEVRDGGEETEVEDTAQRFDLFASVLALDGWSRGLAYWEVEVSDKTGWDLGVARGGAERRGGLLLDPDHGFWVTVHYDDDKYAALTVPAVPLPLKDKPKKVGVFVDYEEGLVSFYDITAQTHIYSFTQCLFREEIFPYFSPHTKKGANNTRPLIISAPRSHT